jgi:hypothetical protein
MATIAPAVEAAMCESSSHRNRVVVPVATSAPPRIAPTASSAAAAVHERGRRPSLWRSHRTATSRVTAPSTTCRATFV